MAILDGRTIVAKNYVTFPNGGLYNTEEQIQPNGIDLRLAKVYELSGTTYLPEQGKAKFDGRATEVEPKEGWYHLRPQAGSVYLVDFMERAAVQPGFCAQIITRSSLVRSGVDVITGLWDTGWEGQLGASLRVMNPIHIQYGARMAQVMFYKAVFNGHTYNGRYQGADSQTAIVT